MPPIRAYHLSLAARIGERPMLRQSRQTSAPRRGAQQIDLFAENAPTSGGMPAWFGLPMETQAALTTLMTRLSWTMPTSAGWVRRGTVMISDKIRAHHLERKAILYVRQS